MIFITNFVFEVELIWFKNSLGKVNENVWRDVYSGEELDSSFIPWSNNEPNNGGSEEVSA